MPGQRFPFSISFQEKLLGMLVESPESMALAKIIRSDYFELPLHKRLASIMVRQAQKLGMSDRTA